MTGFASAWNDYLCAMYGHVIQWACAATGVSQSQRAGTCRRCGRFIRV